MPVSAKPVAYSLNGDATYAPDHLFMVDEGSGTALNDIGVSAPVNGTITGADWVTNDPTHTRVLSFVAANSDRIDWASVLGCTTSATVLVVAKVPSTLAAAGDICGFANSAVGAQYYALGIEQSNARLRTIVRNTTSDSDTLVGVNFMDDTWHLLAFTVQNNARKMAYDGSNFQADTFSVTFAGVSNIFTVGYRGDSTPDSYMQCEVAMVAVYENTVFADADFAAVWNGGNVWAGIGLSQTPTITDASAASPLVEGTSEAISGSNFEPASTDVAITFGGIAQTVTAGTNTTATFTCAIGLLLYGTEYELIATNSLTLESEPILRSMIPAAGEDYWDLGTLGSTASQLLEAIPSLVDGAQIHGLELRDGAGTPVSISLVTIESDGSISLDASITDPTGYELDVRANNRDGEGWGAMGTLTVSLEDALGPVAVAWTPVKLAAHLRRLKYQYTEASLLAAAIIEADGDRVWAQRNASGKVRVRVELVPLS